MAEFSEAIRGKVESDFFQTYSALTTERERILALNEEAFKLRLSAPHAALELAQKAQQLAENTPFQHELAKSLFIQGAANATLRSYESAVWQLSEAKNLFVLESQSAMTFEACKSLGDTYYSLGNYEKALLEFIECIGLSKLLKEVKREALAQNNLGNVYFSLGDYEKSLLSYIESARLHQSLKDEKNEAAVNINIGNVYYVLKRYEQALNYQQKSLEQLKRMSRHDLVAKAYNNIGIILGEQGKFDEALASHHQGLTLSQQISDQFEEANSLNNIGAIYDKLNNPIQALAHFSHSLRLFEDIGDLEGSVETMLSLGILHLKRNEIEQSLLCLNRALSLAEESKSHKQLVGVYSALSKAHRKIGDYEKALYYLELFLELREQTFNDESDRKFKSLQISYEVERAQREAELYRIKNTELTKAYEQLRAQALLLEKQAREDGLTGLNNRRYFEHRFAEEFERALRFNHPLSVAICDVDFFKKINDRFSHAIGDEVLRTVAKIFRQSIRQVDILGRYGGEEFVFLFPETALERAVMACEKIRKSVEDYNWSFVQEGLTVTVSIGVTSDLRVFNHEKMMSNADEKLYQAKNNGRNRVCH
jgi:diguanylate cyclase (GGDEF)-like protein